MIKTSIAKLRVAISKLCWEIILWTSAKIPTDSSNLPDLCPTDNATDAEQYIDRLWKANTTLAKASAVILIGKAPGYDYR